MNVLLETRGVHERRWKRYPTYRDSGVEWLGAVPEGWDVKRLKYCAARINEKVDGRESDLPYTGLEHIESWTGRLTPSEEISTSEGQSSRYEPGDVLFGKLRPYLAKAFRANEHGICTGELLVLRPKDVSQDYLFSYVLARDFISIVDSSTYGAKMPRASWDFIGDLPVLLPSEAEQRTIAAFLDRETGRIDALIAKKGRQIELLQEKRTALISHAVTKGLDPDAPMKDSGVEWLGEVPEHWTFLPLKRNWQVTDCKHKTVSFIDEGVPVASIGEVQGIDVDLYNAKMTTSEEYRELIDGGRKPKRGDIIYSRNATVGAAAFVNTDIDFCMGQDVCLISSKTNSQRFLVYQLRSPAVMNQLDSLVVGATFKRINVAQIKNFLVACPSQTEQDAIAIHCDKVSHRNDIFITKLSESISKLREYRTALISAAVTGKIDVREELVS